MRSFLVKGKKPICKWGSLKDNTFFIGEVPEGYTLGVSPSKGFVVVDVDFHKGIDGSKNIPITIQEELNQTLSYPTKNNGHHYWLEYTGTMNLGNKTSGLGIDLRTSKGYVVWYKKEEVLNCLHLIKETSQTMNDWLESLFYLKKDKTLHE